MLKGVTLYLLSFLLAHAEIELVGLNSSSDGIFVLLSDSVTNSTSGWITQGDTFKGYTVLEFDRSEEHTSELQSLRHLVCRLLLEKKKNKHHSVCDIYRGRALDEPPPHPPHA